MKPNDFDIFLAVWNEHQGLETPLLHIKSPAG